MATTWSQSSGDKAATWTSNDIDSDTGIMRNEIRATWTQSSGEIAAAWLGTELMQFGFLFWEGVDYDWEDEMAYTDTYGATQQDESSGKWEYLG